jgi:uncharacterized Zn finger protein
MNKKKNFVARNENFICDHCGRHVVAIKKGTYRNHCPACLYSKHVDDSVPGDRGSKCQGLMEPRGIVLSGKGYVLIHHCLECGKVSNNKTAPDDNFEKLLELSQYGAI